MGDHSSACTGGSDLKRSISSRKKTASVRAARGVEKTKNAEAEKEEEAKKKLAKTAVEEAASVVQGNPVVPEPMIFQVL